MDVTHELIAMGFEMNVGFSASTLSASDIPSLTCQISNFPEPVKH
jgi:hypothetical protein